MGSCCDLLDRCPPAASSRTSASRGVSELSPALIASAASSGATPATAVHGADDVGQDGGVDGLRQKAAHARLERPLQMPGAAVAGHDDDGAVRGRRDEFLDPLGVRASTPSLREARHEGRGVLYRPTSGVEPAVPGSVPTVRLVRGVQADGCPTGFP
jgi:hypothetical protein